MFSDELHLEIPKDSVPMCEPGSNVTAVDKVDVKTNQPQGHLSDRQTPGYIEYTCLILHTKILITNHPPLTPPPR